MKTDCEIIRDLLPLYADDACSGKSRTLVDEHLAECPACGQLLEKLQSTELEAGLKTEKDSVIAYGRRSFRRRSSVAGSVVSGIFMIPILVCLVVNLASGQGLGWFFIVLASLLVAASLILVPIIAERDKLFWTFCAFCVSLIVLLAVVCLYTGGRWFWIASSAALFGLSVLFLPFAVKAGPVRRLIGSASRTLVVLAIDAALFLNMMNMITLRRGFTLSSVLLLLGTAAGIAAVALEIIRKRGE